MSRPATGQVLERRGKRGRTTYALRFRAYGRRNYLTLDVSTRADADVELANVLADVRRGIWQPPAEPVAEAPREVPTFHRFATDWVDRHKREVRPRTLEFWTWLLSGHLLRAFAPLPLTAITVELIDRYRTSKLREQGLVERPLSNTSINRSLSLLERILDEAVEYELIDRNPAAGKRRRLRPTTPNRTWLEPHEAQAVLRRGRQISAAARDADFSAGCGSASCRTSAGDKSTSPGAKLRVIGSKTEAGVRVVDLSPMLLDELKAHKAAARYADPTSLVFCTAKGTPLNRNNIRTRVIGKAVERANAALAEAGVGPIADGITNHSLRRTFASLLYEAGASPAYVMSQMGHTSSALALEVSARKMARSRETGARMDALIRGAEWAQMGKNGAESAEVFSVEETQTAG